MAKNSKKSKTSGINLKVWVVAVGAAIAVSIWAFGLAEAGYQRQLTSMKDAISRADRDVLKPAGGQPHWGPLVVHGSNLLDKLSCIDTSCPQVEAYWYVPLEVGGYDKFAREVESSIKSNQPPSAGWSVHAYAADLGNKNLPKLEDGKEWRAVHIFVIE